MKAFKLFVSILMVVSPAFGDSWVQATKDAFKTGVMDGVQATKPSGEDDGYLRLATTVYNGYFDESDDAMDGWVDESTGDGTHTVEVVDGGGRTSVLHLYASYGTEETFARASQTFTEGLDFLTRFNFEMYPISSEITVSSRIVLHVFAYDSQGNPIIQGGWLTYLLQGEYTPRYQDWRAQTELDEWNVYRFDLKSDISSKLSVGYTWDDIASVKVMFSIEAMASGRASGAYIDAVWAAPFIDDNFDDNVIDANRWTEYDSLYNISEENQYLRFWGHDDDDQAQTWASLDRERDTVLSSHSCEVSALVRHQYMEDEEGQEFSIGFYAPSSGKYLILKAHRTSSSQNQGVYVVTSCDGTTWSDSVIGTYYFLPMDAFHEWRLLYDADNDKFEAWVDGEMAGRVTNFQMDDYYPYIAATNNEIDTTDSIDCQVDDFMFFDFSQGDYDKRYVQSGEYITAVQDLGFPVNFLKLKWKATEPSGTDVKFQFRSGWTLSEVENAAWRGPNGPGTYYTTSGELIDDYHDGHRYFQVKAILSSDDSMATPTTDSIVVEFDSMAVIEADSGQVELGDGVNTVVHYDNAGRRSLVAYFTDLSGHSGSNPMFTAALHHESNPHLNGGINRWWRLGLEGDYTSVDLVFYYLNSDVPSDMDEGSLVLWRYDGSWTSMEPDERDTSANFLRRNGVTALSEWTPGEPGASGMSEDRSKSPAETAPVMDVLLRDGMIGARFVLPQAASCDFSVYDAAGREVVRVGRSFDKGAHTVWLGSVPHSGIFFLRLEVDGRLTTRKTLVIR